MRLLLVIERISVHISTTVYVSEVMLISHAVRTTEFNRGFVYTLVIVPSQ